MTLLNYKLPICKCLAYPFPRHFQRLGQHSGFADDAYEIGVRDPARQDVHVDMSRHTGTRGFAYVHAEVDADVYKRQAL